ncbi:hypothetical protein G3M48_002992 [Beauveria asiatica]|uniref:Uncharacterized protein n=1 Tax=Beauveria asiatica TaxID=1069075 RepID=A0AAW0RWY0_9HYPO
MAASLPLDYHIDDQYQFSLTKDEVMFMKDETVGRQVSVMVDGKIPLQSVEGFTLLKRNVIDNSDIIEAVRSYLQCETDDQPLGLGLYRTLGPVPGAYAFRRSYPGQFAESVLVHLLPKHSKIRIWKGIDRRAEVPVRMGEIPLWQADNLGLGNAGLKCREEVFDQGGWCVRDTRVFIEVLSGKAFTFAIAKLPLPQMWHRMKVHKSLRSTVEEIQTATFEIRAEYYDNEGQD